MSQAVVPFGIQNANSLTFVAGSAANLAFTNLDQNEIGVFDRDLLRLASIFSLSADLSRRFIEERDSFLFGASVAKRAFNIDFGGSLPGAGAFGMQIIRPITAMGFSTIVPAQWVNPVLTTPTSWLVDYTADGVGWTDLWARGTGDPVNFGNTGPGTNSAQNYRDRVSITAPLIGNFSASPKAREIALAVSTTTYPIWPLDWEFFSNMFIAKIPATLLIAKNIQFNIRTQVAPAGLDSTALVGITYATQDYLVQEI